MKLNEFKVNSIEEFQDMVNKKDMNVHKAIVGSILNNLKTKKKNIHMFSINCIKEDTVFDITLERDHFVDTLNENLVYFEDQELYEECAKINTAIKSLIKTK
tara:strand:+ start:2857 stop:3162 length:306 start_codon:yes stop_codon:yes gene_type:complete